MTHHLPRVSGYCPACGTASLFLGDGGYVTCSWIDCPNPDAATTILADGRETEHIVIFEAASFTVLHPLRERIDDAVLTCPLGASLAARVGPPPAPGRYRAIDIDRDGSWYWELIEQGES